jgi:hypothetical protein
MKIISIDNEDVQKLDNLAKDGKQRRVNSPPWGTDFVCLILVHSSQYLSPLEAHSLTLTGFPRLVRPRQRQRPRGCPTAGWQGLGLRMSRKLYQNPVCMIIMPTSAASALLH